MEAALQQTDDNLARQQPDCTANRRAAGTPQVIARASLSQAARHEPDRTR